MTITIAINAVGVLRATEMIQSASADAAIEHRAGLHTVTMAVPRPDDAGSRAQEDARRLPASVKRVVDITV
jgi:hypothetical protein